MKNYIFYLEPYVLLDICKDSAILINTLDNKKLLFEDSEIVRILSPFLDLKSAILKFSDADITPAFETLLSQIKEAYMGDYFEINPESNLPFQYPLFNAYKELMKNRLFQKNINYISDIILMTDNPLKSTIALEKFQRFIDFFKGNQNVRFTIKGDDLWGFSSLSKFLEMIGTKNQVTLSFDYHFFDKAKDFQFADNICLKALIYPDIEQTVLSQCIDSMKDKNTDYVFHVSSLEEYNAVLEEVQTKQLGSYKIVPFFTESNYDFLREYVFTDSEDLQSLPMSRRKFIANHFVNSLAFGKIYIRLDGNVYTNLKEAPIGTIQDSPIEISNKGLISEWTKTRFIVEPCKNCIYRSLCPSISDLENRIGINDLCFKNNKI